MRQIRWVALGTVLCFALLGSASMAGERALTAGEFAVQLADVVTNKATYTPETAVAMLSGMGFTLPSDLSAQVTQAEFVEAFNQIGANLVTTQPDAVITQNEAKRLFDVFDSFGGSAAETHVDNNSIKCKSGVNKGDHCITDADCPGSFCNIPPGQAKKLASPGDG